jgi:uncharacterized protein (TIGR03437 family)
VFRLSLALAILCSGVARGAGPTYSAAGIVNASNYAAGPFAAGSVISIFGTGLARSTYVLAASDVSGAMLPFELNYVRIYVQDQPVPLLFVSPGQINFIMSNEQLPGPVRIRVVTEGITGPEVAVTLVDSAPALFAGPNNYALATDAKSNLLTADNRARAGDIIVIYATGLGRTSPAPRSGEIPRYAGQMAALASLKITLAGRAVDPIFIKYAGLTPGSAGLYQINLEVPPGTDPDPEIQVTAGTQLAPANLKIPIQ